MIFRGRATDAQQPGGPAKASARRACFLLKVPSKLRKSCLTVVRYFDVALSSTITKDRKDHA